MERVYHKAKNHQEAEDWDMDQHLRMTPEERQSAAKELRRRVYGDKTVDVRASIGRK
ncbi:MAG: hypothetical protein JW932_05460 [Deltaproteobacteria bacterium]|nr:hypothetical protein [Deltaproteobacteria bacterium]